MEDRPSRAIVEQVQSSSEVLARLATDAACVATIEAAARRVVDAIGDGGKVLFVGNGGSAAEAQHFAAELVGRLASDRPAVAALALTTDTSVLTALGNDYGQDQIFARQIEALGRPGDVLIALSTSAKSPNVLAALRDARARGLVTVGLTGAHSGAMAPLCDYVIGIPSDDTARIQEGHLVVGHVLCGLVEQLRHAPAAG